MNELVKLCRKCSLEEFAQSGGGNISVKDGNTLYIKASGVSLSEVTVSRGYSVVNNHSVINTLKNDVEADVRTFVIGGSARPSLEVYFHSFLKKYVVHLHPTALNNVLCSKQPVADMIPYCKPGFALSKKIFEQYSGQSIIYLQNHGVILHADTYLEIIELIKNEHMKYAQHWSTNLLEFWTLQDTFPEDFIYKIPYEDSQNWHKTLKTPIQNITPDITLFLHDSIILTETALYIRAQNKQKALNIMEVLRGYCRTIHNGMQSLTDTDVCEILDWEVEKYRQKL